MVRVAFFGSHGLGERCLEILDEHPDVTVSVVVTCPEGYDSWWEGSVHRLATNLGYDVLTTSEESDVLQYDIDYLISVYYPNILGPELLEHPEEAALNLHQAELPRYRGSNVFSHAIMNAREDDYWQYGTTIHFMADEVDAGDVVDRNFVEIRKNDTARSLYERTRKASIELFEDTLPDIVTKDVTGTPQEEFDGEQYFYTKDSLDGLKEIPPEELSSPANPDQIYDRIRALEFPPHEPAFTTIGSDRIYLTTDLDTYY